MNYMINKIVAIQGDHPSTLNPLTDTTIFLANEIQKKKYKIFYYEPKNLSIINFKVIASGFFIRFDYNKKNLRQKIMNYTNEKGVDLVIDPVGSKNWKLSYKCLAKMGKLIIYGNQSFVKGDKLNLYASIKEICSMPNLP